MVKFVERVHAMDPVELLRYNILEYVRMASESQLRKVERLQMEDIRIALELLEAKAEKLIYLLAGEEEHAVA